jgi:hypothetical protein
VIAALVRSGLGVRDLESGTVTHVKPSRALVTIKSMLVPVIDSRNLQGFCSNWKVSGGVITYIYTNEVGLTIAPQRLVKELRYRYLLDFLFLDGRVSIHGLVSILEYGTVAKSLNLSLSVTKVIGLANFSSF